MNHGRHFGPNLAPVPTGRHFWSKNGGRKPSVRKKQHALFTPLTAATRAWRPRLTAATLDQSGGWARAKRNLRHTPFHGRVDLYSRPPLWSKSGGWESRPPLWTKMAAVTPSRHFWTKNGGWYSQPPLLDQGGGRYCQPPLDVHIRPFSNSNSNSNTSVVITRV